MSRWDNVGVKQPDDRPDVRFIKRFPHICMRKTHTKECFALQLVSRSIGKEVELHCLLPRRAMVFELPRLLLCMVWFGKIIEGRGVQEKIDDLVNVFLIPSVQHRGVELQW